MSASEPPPPGPARARVAATCEVTAAEGWAEQLAAEGIDARVELADERSAMPAQNPLVGEGGSPSSIVYAVTVPEADAPAALQSLRNHIEAAGDREDAADDGPTPGMRRAAWLLVALVLALLGGLALAGMLE